MKKSGSVLLGLWILLIPVIAQPGLGQTEQPSNQPEFKSPSDVANIRAGTRIGAELESAVDARMAKPGDQVVARVTKDVKQDNRVVIRKGDRLIGRISSVEANDKTDAGSSLSIQFDRLMKGLATSRLNTVVAAVLSTPGEESTSPEPRTAEPAMSAPPRARSSGPAVSGGGLVGGLASTVDSTVGVAGSVVGNAGGVLDSAVRTTASTAAGIVPGTPARAIRVRSRGQTDQQAGSNSVLSTRQGQLRLESGTSLLFRVVAQGETQDRGGVEKHEVKDANPREEKSPRNERSTKSERQETPPL